MRLNYRRAWAHIRLNPRTARRASAANQNIAPPTRRRHDLGILSGFRSPTVTRLTPYVAGVPGRIRVPKWASKEIFTRILFFLAGFLTLSPIVSSGTALIMGFLFAFALGNPYLELTQRWTPTLLQVSVVGLGATMNLITIGVVGVHGLLYTAVGILVTLAVGFALHRLFRTDHAISILLAAGTAICGGSAIAAVAPAIQAKDHQVSVSLATVFILNAVALFLFPWIGHMAGFDQIQFGLWSALAIHDTSSVVGAGMQYGTKALEIATTVKLARALWIVPVVFVVGAIWVRKFGKSGQVTARKPWFILGFLLMAALITWMPGLTPAGHVISEASQRTFVLSLFLIGSGIGRTTLKSIGPGPLIHGLALWVVIASASFLAISMKWVNL